MGRRLKFHQFIQRKVVVIEVTIQKLKFVLTSTPNFEMPGWYR